MIQNSRSVDDLPTKILVVTVANEKRLGSECIRLHIHVTTGNLVHKATLSDVWEPAHQNSSSVGIEGRETRHVLANFFQIRETRFLALENGTHSSKSSAFEALAAIKRVTVLDHANHVSRDLVNKGTSSVDLTQGELVMVAIIESVAKIRIERVNIIQTRKICQNLAEAFRNGLLCKLDLSHAVSKNKNERMSDRGL